jgi:hypothetical protein
MLGLYGELSGFALFASLLVQSGPKFASGRRSLIALNAEGSGRTNENVCGAIEGGHVMGIRVSRSVEELRTLLGPWRRLQGRHYATDPDIFPLILSWQQAVRPHVIELERDGETRAVVLGRIEDMRLRTNLGYATVYKPQVRVLTIIYRGVLGELADDDAQLVLAHLRRSLGEGEADVLRLRQLAVGSPLHRAATTIPPRMLRETGSPRTWHWELDVPSSYDAFLRSLSRTSRDGAKRYPRRLEKQYGDRISVVMYHDLTDADRVFTDVRTVSERTYQHRLGAAFPQTELQRRIATMFMERGWFRACVVYLDGKPISFWHGHAYRGAFSTGVPGFDPAYAGLRVGNYALFKLIENLCEDETIDTLDYGFGDAEYKRRYGTRSWEEQDVHVFAPTAKGVRTNMVRGSMLGLSSVAERAFARDGALDRLKRSWRKRLSQSDGA